MEVDNPNIISEKISRDAQKWQYRKVSVIEKYDYRCAYCGCKIDLQHFQIDHIVPKLYYELNKDRYYAEGFKLDGIENLNPACFSCNNYKRAHSLEVFRGELEKQIERLRRDHPTFRLAERYGLIECNPIKIIFYFEKISNA